jgi:hypothetical protein
MYEVYQLMSQVTLYADILEILDYDPGLNTGYSEG